MKFIGVDRSRSTCWLDRGRKELANAGECISIALYIHNEQHSNLISFSAFDMCRQSMHVFLLFLLGFFVCCETAINLNERNWRITTKESRN